jgi:trafficking protein particle complex subunit 11
MIGSKLKKDTKIEDVLTLNPIVNTLEWITKSSYLKKDNKLIFHRHAQLSEAPAPPSASDSLSRSGSLRKSDDQVGFNKNLLSKIPSNATIIGANANMLTTNSQMSSSTSSLGEDKSNLNITSDTESAKPNEKDAANFLAITKNVYNKAIDGVHLTIGDSRGFFRACLDEPPHTQHFPAFGIYCMKWKRSHTNDVNESKFIINGIGRRVVVMILKMFSQIFFNTLFADVIEPPLNIYSYFDKKLYVRIPITWKITIKNPSNKIVYLQAILNGSDSFMFAGHRQVKCTSFFWGQLKFFKVTNFFSVEHNDFCDV